MSLLLEFWPYLAAAGAAVVALWRVYAMGKNSEKTKQAKERLAARTEADKIDQTVAGMTDEEVLKEQAKWSRPKR